VPNLTIAVDEALMRQIKAHPGINWSEAAREGLRRRLREIHVWDELLKDSELTQEDVERLADEVDEAMLRHLKDLVE
jgi:hypothetical protein